MEGIFCKVWWYGWTLLAQNVGSLNCHALPWGICSAIFLLNFEFSLLLVCMWRHGGHVGGVLVVRTKAFLSSIVLTTNTPPTWPPCHRVASQESGCCQNLWLHVIHMLEMNEFDVGKMNCLNPDFQRKLTKKGLVRIMPSKWGGRICCW